MFSAVISVVSIALSLTITHLSADPASPPNYMIAFLAPSLVAPPVSFFSGWSLLRYHRINTQLKYLLDHDTMTGLLVRGAFFREIKELRASTCALFLLDIDHFKSVNDRYDHAVGDKVIAAVGAYLQTLNSVSAVSARFGGEEFAVLVPIAAEAAGRAIGERIVKDLEDETVTTAEYGDISFTVSAGLCLLEEGDDIDLGLVTADTALYQAKESGRNRLCIAPPRTRALPKSSRESSQTGPVSSLADRLPLAKRGASRKPA